MSDRTAIAWCDATVNFWWGCTRVSPGCQHCYAETLAAMRPVGSPPRNAGWGPKGERVPIVGAGHLASRLNRRAEREGRRLRVFTNSISDFFDPAVPEDWRRWAWSVIDGARNVDWLILTKRPENFASMIPPTDGWPHVWLGISAEDQERANERIPILLETPAAVRWLSAEPLLGPLNLTSWLRVTEPRIGWAVIGGESGPGHRDCEVSWIADLVGQCAVAGVPAFVKQDSGPRPGQWGRIPEGLRIREFPCP